MRWLSVVVALQVLMLACDDAAMHGPAGAACGRDADCEALVCAADLEAEPEDLAQLPLACATADGEAAGPGAACRRGAECDHGLCLLAGACALPCAADDDCGELERCRPVYARSSDATLQTARACVPLVSLPAGARFEVDEAAATLTESGGTVELPAPFDGADTFYVLEHLDESWPGSVCRPPTCVLRVAAADAPDDALFDAEVDYRTEPPPRLPVATGSHIHTPVLRVDAALANADGYVVSLEAEMAGGLRVTRIARDADAAPAGRIDLNVFYLDGMGWEPEGDRGPEALAAALEEVDAILEPAGLFIGEVRQLSVPGKLPEEGTYLDSESGFRIVKVRFGVWRELPNLFRLSDGAGNTAVNLFLVSDIEPLPNGDEPLAHGGGIPGPPAMHGTGSSGIAVAVDMLAGDSRRLGSTLAHELSHYLGLFHPSERDGRVVENLDDTPACGVELDANDDGLLDLDECSGAGDANLMFWGPGVDTLLTPEQRAVLRGSPLVQ